MFLPVGVEEMRQTFTQAGSNATKRRGRVACGEKYNTRGDNKGEKQSFSCRLVGRRRKQIRRID